MTESLIEVASKAAGCYARRVFWAELEDLRQEAIIAALSAFRTWDSECGIPLNAYAWRACCLHLRSFCWRQSAPVHGDSWRPKGLRGLHRALLDENMVDPAADSFDLLAEKQWVEKASTEIQLLLSELGDGAQHATRVLLQEEAPPDVARTHAIKVGVVYRAARNARALIGNDAVLHDMLKEKIG